MSHARLAADPPGSVVNANVAAAAVLILNELLTSLVSRDAVAVRV